MAEITAAMVKSLRQQTGQGMMECKKALQEANGDVEAARDLLRKKGLATAQKKAGRVTKEGLVAVHTVGSGSAAMVEVDCETDFCAQNDVFRTMVADVAELAAGRPDGQVEATDDITNAVQAAFDQIGENMRYVRGIRISAAKVGTYVHHNGKVGVLVGVDRDLPDEALADLCMHIAFADPMGITADDVPAELVEKEKEIAMHQAVESGKPREIAEKIVAGKIRKFVASNALLEQPFVRDEKKKVKDVLGGATVTAFARFAVGESG
jgi:elongation factor Ts